jgi:AcrR family transcriptional regulator
MRRRISSGYNRGCCGSAAVKDHRPRKVPQQQRSQETVNAVFEAVVQMIEKRDVNDPTVSAIAERAGVSVGSVYQYFPTKEALIASLIGFHLKQRMAELDAAIASVAGLGQSRRPSGWSTTSSARSVRWCASRTPCSATSCASAT